MQFQDGLIEQWRIEVRQLRDWIRVYDAELSRGQFPIPGSEAQLREHKASVESFIARLEALIKMHEANHA